MEFIVTEKAQRPANMNGRCFYCDQPIGEQHKSDCVHIRKTVKVRMIVEYEVDVPADWGKQQVEFHRNEGSWCSNNALDELERLAEEKGCLCHAMEFEYLGGDSEPYLNED